ncbi:MAG: ABC transporter substrate-binding protein [Bryobacterales bacterium]|nr:ABC transporter substrate-binding protein [Bryobacterales bacterium]
MRLAMVWLAAAAICLAQPRRIVSTAPSITEMLYALGLGGRVAGVTTFCRYPPEAAAKPKIGNYLRPNAETILSLRPDLVIVESSMLHQNGALSRLGLNLLEVNDSTVDGIYQSVRSIGRAAGVPARAEQVCSRTKRELEGLRERTRNLPRLRVLFVVGRTPGRLEDLIAAGAGSYLGELIELAGGRNAFHDAVVPYSRVSLEEVLSRNPDVIIDMGEMARAGGVSEEEKRGVAALWGRNPTLRAVRSGRVFAVASDIFVVPGPRVAEAARRIAALLHPEAVE